MIRILIFNSLVNKFYFLYSKEGISPQQAGGPGFYHSKHLTLNGEFLILCQSRKYPALHPDQLFDHFSLSFFILIVTILFIIHKIAPILDTSAHTMFQFRKYLLEQMFTDFTSTPNFPDGLGLSFGFIFILPNKMLETIAHIFTQCC